MMGFVQVFREKVDARAFTKFVTKISQSGGVSEDTFIKCRDELSHVMNPSLKWAIDSKRNSYNREWRKEDLL